MRSERSTWAAVRSFCHSVIDFVAFALACLSFGILVALPAVVAVGLGFATASHYGLGAGIAVGLSGGVVMFGVTNSINEWRVSGPR